MKCIIYSILLFFFSTVCYANNIWHESIFTPESQTVYHIVDNERFRLDLTHTRGQFRDVTINLDNTLFGRAHKIENVDLTAQIKSAWTQGYSGQGINIGVVDYFYIPSWYLPVNINNVNTADVRGTYSNIRLDISSKIYDFEYSSDTLSRTANPSSSLDRNWSKQMHHGDISKHIAGGKHEDSGGTLMLGIAKDANIFHLDLFPRDHTQLNSQYYNNRFDFIYYSYFLINPPSGPLRTMGNRYRSMDQSGTYPQGHLPVYVISGGNEHGNSATYAGISQRVPFNSNYYSTEMALSSDTFDGRPFSDYLLIAGGVVSTGETTYAPAGNMPGEVTELQNRWIVAPYAFQTDASIRPGVSDIRGTSFSAPYITGIAAIVNSKFPELSPVDVAGILLNTTRDLGAPGTDPVYGRGMVDLANALSPQ
ncbi:MAG: S8 family serine peptidase [Desulfobacterales bacterium]|nr:S8 family serine peptidase [Desulfobacterales bacterium]